MSEATRFHFNGGFKELIRLFLPISVMTFSNGVFLLVEKLLLARLSAEAMEAAVSAAYACQLCQIPCIALAMMAQVYVGRWKGAQQWEMIGPGMWQFIWFSFLSMVITVPVSILYGHYYYRGTVIEEITLPYFHFLVFINFLYPLATALSCFYLGQGKTRLVLFATIGSQVAKLVLAYFLIFGLEGWVTSMGIMGGALSTFIAQSGYCLVLFAVFINSRNSIIFQTRKWMLRWNLFWECIHPGLLRALNRILMVTSWASIARLMTAKGGDYLLVLSVGGTLFLFLPFLADAICQSQITIVSNILGSRRFHLMSKAFRTGSLLAVLTMGIVSLPLIFFPNLTFKFFFPSIFLSPESIQNVFLGVWACFALFTFSYIPISYILAFKDTKFLLFMGAFNWVNGFLLMYIAIVKMDIAADQFWLTLTLMHGSMALLYYARMRWLQSKALTLVSQAS